MLCAAVLGTLVRLQNPAAPMAAMLAVVLDGATEGGPLLILREQASKLAGALLKM